MKKQFFALMFALVWMVASAQSTFSPVTGKAFDIAIGANGAVWSVGTNFVVNQWNGSGWTQAADQEGKWELKDKVWVWQERKDMIRVAVDPQGNPWAIDKKFVLWRLVNNVWQQVATNTVSVGFGVNGSIYRTDVKYDLYQWNGTNWGTSLDSDAADVFVSPQSNPWTTSTKGQISRLVNGKLERVAGETYSLAISANGMVFHVGADYRRIWLWTGTNWVNIGEVPNASRIAADPRGALWVVTKEGVIYKSTPFTP